MSVARSTRRVRWIVAESESDIDDINGFDTAQEALDFMDDPDWPASAKVFKVTTTTEVEICAHKEQPRPEYTEGQ